MPLNIVLLRPQNWSRLKPDRLRDYYEPVKVTVVHEIPWANNL